MDDCGPVADPGAGGLGFSRALRLLKPREFSEVFAARRVWRSDRFALHFKENGLSHPRLGLVIAKKQARTAVSRNAIKRQAREAFRLRQASLPAYDLVLRLTRPVTTIERSALRAEIDALLDRLGRVGKANQEAVREGGLV